MKPKTGEEPQLFQSPPGRLKSQILQQTCLPSRTTVLPLCLARVLSGNTVLEYFERIYGGSRSFVVVASRRSLLLLKIHFE